MRALALDSLDALDSTASAIGSTDAPYAASYSFQASFHSAFYPIISNQSNAVTFGDSEVDSSLPHSYTILDFPPPIYPYYLPSTISRLVRFGDVEE
jgi:hypothetical protein